MNSMMLVAAGPTWVNNWLTPVWIISVGALIGLALLLVLWGCAAIVSRLPGLSERAEDPKRRLPLVGVVAVILFGLIVVLGVRPAATDWQSEGTFLENWALVALLGIPFSIGAAFALVSMSSRRAVAEIPGAVREGPLWPIFYMLLILAGFAVSGVVVVSQPAEIMQSLARAPFVGSTNLSFKIPAANEVSDAADPPQNKIDVSFNKAELRLLVFNSPEALTIDTKETSDIDIDPPFEVAAEEEMRWLRTSQSYDPFEGDEITALYVRNYGNREADLDLTVVTQPKYPQAEAIIIVALGVVGLFLLYLLQRTVMPRLSAVALSTLKSEMAQPLFAILMAIGCFALVTFVYIPYNTFGEDIKVLKDSGMTLVMVLCIIQAVWAAGTSISDEIEGRTALTVLSKPIGRRSFIIGKYMGIFWTVAVMFCIFGLILMVTVAYKPIYDARETSNTEPIWQICMLEMVGVVPGLLLGFMETCVLAAISVAISTRLPMLANFIISFSIYVLGNLAPLLVQNAVVNELFEPVVFFAQLISAILPILDHFNIQAAIAGGATVPFVYLAWATVYCMIYGVVALLFALVLFEDRDLA
jgi:ABC-type transport system involved in multi-copper enzyme maturation permease subunit